MCVCISVYIYIYIHIWKTGLPRWHGGKESPWLCRRRKDTGLLPGSGRSPGEGNGNPSSILDWRIPWTEELGKLQSMGSRRVGHNWACMHIRMFTYYLSIMLKTCEQFKITNKSRTRRKLKREGTYVYLWLIHVDIWQKPTQYCKAIILQLKINKFKFKKNFLRVGLNKWSISIAILFSH